MRSEDLFAAAEQTDIVAIIDVDEFVAKVPYPQPARFDRLQTFAQTFAVEAWRPAPNYTNPVVFKVLLRGGTQ
jgi:hypothetical protein